MTDNEDSLVVIWTSGDREVALKMVFMYIINSKLRGWWEDIRLIVWGPSQKLLTEDMELQDHIKKIKETGTLVEACKSCSDEYGISKKLENFGIEVRHVGEFLTGHIKKDGKIITF